ncbi:DUF4912 domain-containing protein [Microseira sp. BLCC-F43]|uniref:DUF4912 domain-containing protein n=1 Tax=Microseira sp. BLCC-F43 TaxID=3153602 RepID=UPI0035B85C75
MATFSNKEKNTISLAIFLALLAVTPKPIAAAGTIDTVVAKAAAPTSFPLAADVPGKTTVRVDGSSSMKRVNQALKQRFEQKFPGTKVEISEQGSDRALKELVEGKIDIAAIGRPLTKKEKAQGLVQVPLSRQKIAIVVGPDNAFNKSLTFDQFGRIFRGEIRNWSQVGGKPGIVRLIDRPADSDTRKAFQSYKVFQTGGFKTGSNAEQIGKDSTTEVIKHLGKNGIGYAIADQVLGRKNVRILPMHGVLPDNPKYPFSQTLSYVYYGPTPNPAVQWFLGYATDTSNQQVVKQAISDPTAPDQTVADISPRGGETAKLDGRIPWWMWLLLISALGGLLWLLLKNRKALAASSAAKMAAAAPAALPAAPAVSHLFLVPYDGKNAYAYWEIATAQIEALQRQGGKELLLRLYDITNIAQGAHDSLACLQQFGCNLQDRYLLLTLPALNRDYIVELGLLAETGQWLSLTRSGAVRVNNNYPTGNIIGLLYGSNGNGEAAYRAPAPSHSRIFLVPYDGKNAYAYWEIDPRQIEALQRQGGEKLVLRLYDITDIPDSEQHSLADIEQFDCNPNEQYFLLALPEENRDYIVELGLLTQAGNWLSLTRSGKLRVAKSIPTDDVVLAMMLHDRKNVYAYWEIPPEAIQALKHQE